MALNNIGNMMKIMNAWNIFKRNHPKFPAFCNAVSKRALKEGSIMAITVTTPDGEKIETNLRIKAEDLVLLIQRKPSGFHSLLRGLRPHH